MIEVRQTPTYTAWLDSLTDKAGKARINARVDRLAFGLTGDVKPVGSGVSELRMDFGPGYRVYFIQRGRELIILLAGGDKASQTRDIKKAIAISKEV